MNDLNRYAIYKDTVSLKITSVPPSAHKALAAVAGLMLIGYGSTAIAQSGPDAGALQQQLQREVERNATPVAPEQLIKKQAKPSKPKTAAKAIEVTSFKITGMTLINQDQAQEVLKPFINRQLTLDQIKEAADAITGLYAQRGWVAQAVIPPQDVKNGVIQIKIIEGKVGKVIIKLDKAAASRLKPEVITKFVSKTNPPGGFIDLNGLERSLAILNEIPGSEVDGELSEGDKEETSNIQINAKDTGLFAGRVDLTNYGAANTGPAQAVASLSLNNPSGNGDQATLDAIGSQGSVYGQFKYGMPLGYDGWRVSAGVSALDYKSLSSFSPTISQGTAQTYGLYSTYALERTARSNKNVTVNFENKNYNNQVNGIQSSNYQINNLTAGLNGGNLLDNAYASWGLTATVGSLSINNTNQATNDAQGAATKGAFGKIGVNGALTKPLPIKKTNLVASVYGQLANKNLNSAEQLYLGGPYGVRAYPVAQGGGSQGAVASLEINHTLVQDLQLGAFFDAGLIQQYISTYNDWQGRTNAGNTYSLYASGLSAKYQYQKVQLTGSLAWRVGSNPLYNSSGLQLNTDNQYRSVQGWIKGSLYF
ncbi:ShlB/FhaC/HecB family hemolysin secretion/activation protein [Polynucleobacter sp. AP-Capit-er-40B-B4]|uniref:ShlB/FhaC/HecB family hemolysin secretion/activation protein n=1 Tax=Polynucleobacter sp. AP-Capit-er-40B-B4 TaxID=2576927 RepID=UPI001C0C9DD5|nr:ShlB/FhaC/HecB family hemolysin secretion/activation protein [Polynucleobacter sp. AP-Capit-er-40B-B4]MBU3582225.1 ShlB/FhaC/HecB family hemolysin secretion/activation protein [Polynucleobacter sp. AP-Capit-er-40B-B4]